jgi:hypothetical protein
VLVPEADAEAALALIEETVTDYEGDDLEAAMVALAEDPRSARLGRRRPDDDASDDERRGVRRRRAARARRARARGRGPRRRPLGPPLRR